MWYLLYVESKKNGRNAYIYKNRKRDTGIEDKLKVTNVSTPDAF